MLSKDLDEEKKEKKKFKEQYFEQKKLLKVEKKKWKEAQEVHILIPLFFLVLALAMHVLLAFSPKLPTIMYPSLYEPSNRVHNDFLSLVSVFFSIFENRPGKKPRLSWGS